MKVSRKGTKFVARWEGFRAAPYNDAAGHCTRGYGELIHYGRCTGEERGIGERKARKRLRETLNQAAVRGAIAGLRLNLRQHEIDALASAIYNLGPGVLTDTGSSTLARRLRGAEASSYAGRRRIYREELPKWDVAGGQHLAGLTARRAAEVRLANHGDYSGRP